MRRFASSDRSTSPAHCSPKSRMSFCASPEMPTPAFLTSCTGNRTSEKARHNLLAERLQAVQRALTLHCEAVHEHVHEHEHGTVQCKSRCEYTLIEPP